MGKRLRPEIGIILGSGIEIPDKKISNSVTIKYKDLGLSPPTVSGHRGLLVIGLFSKVPVAIMRGRLHLYEGYNSQAVTELIKVLKELGVGTLIITNSSGSLKKGLKPGTFLLVEDHINLLGENPLAGIKDERRFLDLAGAYDPWLIKLCKDVAKKKKIKIQKGTIVAVNGPSYETPSEVRMLRALGGDAVCMSAIPEVIMARYLGMKVLFISFITNYAAGLTRKSPDHRDVLEMAGRMKEKFIKILEDLIPLISV
ncbi:MAG: purine-nucleoside phosphorylase [Nitrospirae bacterium]|nr:purine-nucleoside phosphorylase [Nitrospirota bacterium]